MGEYEVDKIIIFTKYQWSVTDVEGCIIGLLTCFGVNNLGLLFKIFSLTTFMMRNWRFLLRQQMETKCTDISDTLEDRIRSQEYKLEEFLKREECIQKREMRDDIHGKKPTATRQ